MAKDNKDTPRFYWDADVFLSAINGPKERLPIIEAILDDCAGKNAELYTSMLSITEVAFAGSEKESCRLNDTIEEKINKLWYPPSPVKLVEISEFVILEAKKLMREAIQKGWSLKPADAIHLATAKRVSPIEIHTYESGWIKYSDMVGCKICEPQIGRFQYPVQENPKKAK